MLYTLVARETRILSAQTMSSQWLKLLPTQLRAKIEHRPYLQKVFNNIGWLFADKILRMGVALFVGIWIARYLGPEQFGLLNYALAIVTLFSAVASMGLNGIVVRDLVKEPCTADTTLGTAFLLQLFGGLLAFALAVVVVSFTRPNDNLARMIVAVLGFILVFKATDVVKYWFESKVQSKYIIWVENSVFLLLAVIKVSLILAKAPLMAFVWAAFVESAIVSLGAILVYSQRGGHLSTWRVNYKRAKSLLMDSWPLILSSLAIVMYMRIDQIMLGQMLDDEAVGIYTAAVRVSEVWYFIPTAIVISVFPSIIESKKQNEVQFYQRLQKLYDLMVLLALAVAIPMTFMSNWVISLLFGADYIQAGTVLAIHIWSGLFVFLGVASGSWYLSENLQIMAFGRAFLGAITNIVANIYLIPRYGVIGAAIGTILSQVVAAYFFDAIYPKTRYTFWMKTKSFMLFYSYKN